VAQSEDLVGLTINGVETLVDGEDMVVVVVEPLVLPNCYAQSVKWKKDGILTTSEISYLYRLWKIHKHGGPRAGSRQ